MKKIILLLFVLLFCVDFAASAPKLLISLDGAMFKEEAGKVRWELYYMLPDTVLKYVAHNSQMRAEAAFTVEISSNIKMEAAKTWNVVNISETGDLNHKINLYGQQNFLITEGEYKVRIKVSDLNDTTNKIETTFGFVTNKYSGKSFSISDIELVQTQIKQEKSVNRNSEFYKGDLALIPNPTSELIGNKLKMYYEIYKPAEIKSIDVNYELYNSSNQKLFRIPRKIASDSIKITEYIEIPFEAVPTGIYTLKIKALQTSRLLDTIETSKKLYVINLNIPPEKSQLFAHTNDFELSEFSTMTDDQIQLELTMMKEVMPKTIREEFKALSTNKARQRALYKYWLERDPDTTTAINEARADFRRRVQFANDNFSIGPTEGWLTERGKILLKYGFWDYRNVYQRKDFKNAAEVWYYPNLQGGAFFYFVDVHNNLSFRLVHATVPGEEHNLNWIEDFDPAIEDEEVLKKFRTTDNLRQDTRLR